jgi:hypothetical protein
VHIGGVTYDGTDLQGFLYGLNPTTITETLALSFAPSGTTYYTVNGMV